MTNTNQTKTESIKIGLKPIKKVGSIPVSGGEY